MSATILSRIIYGVEFSENPCFVNKSILKCSLNCPKSKNKKILEKQKVCEFCGSEIITEVKQKYSFLFTKYCEEFYDIDSDIDECYEEFKEDYIHCVESLCCNGDKMAIGIEISEICAWKYDQNQDNIIEISEENKEKIKYLIELFELTGKPKLYHCLYISY